MLSKKVYEKKHKMRGYTVTASIAGLLRKNEAAAILYRDFPHLDRSAHARLADKAAFVVVDADRAWSRTADREMHRLQGRPFRVTDYKVSGVGCEDFPPRVKEALRRLAHLKTTARAAMDAHAYLAANFGRFGGRRAA